MFVIKKLKHLGLSTRDVEMESLMTGLFDYNKDSP